MINALTSETEGFGLTDTEQKRARFLGTSSVNDMKKMNEGVIEMYNVYGQSIQRKERTSLGVVQRSKATSIGMPFDTLNEINKDIDEVFNRKG